MTDPDPRPRGVTECSFLNSRTLLYCLLPTTIAIPYGSSGLGACPAHIRPVLLYAMEASTGGTPHRRITVYPTEQWPYR
jgi:hypothetical protein